MKNQALCSSKYKLKQIKMSSAAIFVWRFKGLLPSAILICNWRAAAHSVSLQSDSSQRSSICIK